MSTVTVKFRPSRVPGHPGSLVYQISHNSSVRQVASGIRLYRQEWDSSCAASTGTSALMQEGLAASIIRHLEHDLVSIGGIIDDLDRQTEAYTTGDVVKNFRAVQRAPLSFFAFLSETIGNLRRMNRNGTAHNYRAAMESFRRFRNGADISLDKIDRDLMEEYQTFLKSCGLAKNSISFYMRIIRAVYNRACDHGLTVNRKPFQSVFTGNDKTPKRAIPASDISRIRNLDLSQQPRLEFARDIFMFLFYCRGMSFVDAAFLRKSDIRYGYLTYCRRKTGQQLQIKVIAQIADVIDRYIAPCSEYVFPIINTGRNQRLQYETGLRLVNKYLKTVGNLAGLSIRLTTYVARHSWATIAKSRNVPLNMIADALGHESVNTTQIYLASINSSEIDHVNEIVLAGI